MCHHVDMAIDWDEVVANEPESEELDATEGAEEPTADSEESMSEITLPAGD